MDGLGDLWMWLPFVAALRKQYPEEPFYLLVNSLWAEVAEQTNLFARVIPIQAERFRRSVTYRRRAIQELRQRMPPVERIWQSTYSRRIVVEDLLSYAVPARERIAWSRDAAVPEPYWLGNWLDARIYTTLYHSPLPSLTHEWIRYKWWLQQLGLDSLDFGIYYRLREKLRYPSPTPFIAAVVGAGGRARIPPLSLFQTLLQRLKRRMGMPVRLLGTLSDRKFAAALKDSDDVEDYTGRLSLIEAIKSVASASLVISPETGLGHIACTLGIPTLVIAGGGHWGRFIPYPPEGAFPLKVITHEMACFGCGWMCKYQLSRNHPYPCIAQLSPEETANQAVEWAEKMLHSKTQSA
ncbi:MAG: glycosyltransferase family 9 protein [Bacteroidia bacterium]|nr:glycosyltransferase family 9 protein [Bacteroidia bacterium]MCX7651584.1 glycosyltransferase family 9 protein [Bacteroidia bacterium]MDW8417240.1 glycosyltransferase family 9 protein [Bacteroidia bacterium]